MKGDRNFFYLLCLMILPKGELPMSVSRISSNNYSNSIYPSYTQPSIASKGTNNSASASFQQAFLEEAELFMAAPITLDTDSLTIQEEDSISRDIVDKVKSGMSIKDALWEVKTERYEEYFQEELTKNGGDATDAAKKAEARIKAEMQINNEEMQDIVQNLASEYSDKENASKSDDLQKVADELQAYAEELEEKNKLIAEEEKLGKVKNNEQNSNAFKVGNSEEQSIQDVFISNLFASSQNNESSKEQNFENLNEQEKRDYKSALQQYQRVANNF